VAAEELDECFQSRPNGNRATASFLKLDFLEQFAGAAGLFF
jgi:hypothetical protein